MSEYNVRSAAPALLGPIFIIGAQRSGTTLIRLILNEHSRISIPQEADFWLPLLGEYGNFPDRKIPGRRVHSVLREIGSSRYFQLWRIDMEGFFNSRDFIDGSMTLSELMRSLYSYYARLRGKCIWGDKTPPFFKFIPELKAHFPEAKFIHIVRDGRDQYLSRRRYTPLLGANLAVAALEWKYKVERSRAGMARIHPGSSFEIRYEDLVGSPEETIREICTFIQVEYESTMADFYRSSDLFVHESHSRLIRRPISKQSVFKWKSDLSPLENRKFEALCRRTLKKLGYEVRSSWRDVYGTVSAMSSLFLGLPSRLLLRARAVRELRMRFKGIVLDQPQKRD